MASCVEHGEWEMKYFACPKCFKDGHVSQPIRSTPQRETCQLHGEKEWFECWGCASEGVNGHDCGEDCCVCLYPEDNVRCDICSGKGGWWRCYTCAPVTEDETT